MAGGHPGYFGFIAEMKNPEDFPKSLCMQQGFEIILYTVSAAIIYRYAGDGVASPALGSTGPLLRKIAYGIAIPTIVIAGVVLVMWRSRTSMFASSVAPISCTSAVCVERVPGLR